MGFAYIGPQPKYDPDEHVLVYYHIPTDQIFTSGYIDAMFYSLGGGVKWGELEILGLLKERK